MSILVNKDTKVIVQGFTGKEGTFHSTQCIEYGTQIVGGVTPNKGGQTHLGLPVFNTVKEAINATGANTSMIFVPPKFAKDAILEASNSGIKLAIVITDGIPTNDMVYAKKYASEHGMQIIGPNCPGIITPNECKIGIMPGSIFKKGNIGLISKSGTLTYEGANQIAKQGYGISTAIGIGGDIIIGLSFIELLKMMEADEQTKAIVLIGEIGGDLEIQSANFIKQGGVSKPVVAFISGQSAPKGTTMGHAGAIIECDKSDAKTKMQALSDAGVYIAHKASLIGETLAKALSDKGIK